MSTRIARSIVMALCCVAALASTARSSIYLNEIQVHGDEAVELYNASTETVDLSGWRISGTDGDYEIPDGTSIAGQAYLWVSGLGQIMSDLGGETSVIDLTNSGVDGVSYGTSGSAPIPPMTPSGTIARAPDASTVAPPAPDPNDDGEVWTITLYPTPGAFNVTRTPALGTSLRIHDMQLSTGIVHRIELHNPASSAPVSVGGWYITAGSGGVAYLPPLIIPSNETVFLSVQPDFDSYPSGLLYLHKWDGTRLDQLAGSNMNLREEPPQVLESSWGNVKAAYR